MKIANKFFYDFTCIYRILPRRLRVRTFELFFLMLVASLLELALVYAMAGLGMTLTNPDGVRYNFIYRAVFALSPELGNWCIDSRHMLVVAGCGVIVASLCKNCVMSLSMYRMSALSEDISINIGQEIMERYLYRNYAWHLSSKSSCIFQSMLWRNNMAIMLINLLSMYLALTTLLILFFSLMVNEPELTMFTLVSTGLLGFVLYTKMRKTVDRNGHAAAAATLQENKAILCATKGIRDILVYNRQPVFLSSVVEAARMGKEPRIFNSLAPTIPSWVLETAGFGIIVSVIAYLALYRQDSITRTTEALAMLTLTAWRVLPYCNRMVGYQVSIRSLRPIADAVLGLLKDLRQEPIRKPSPVDPNFRFHRDIVLRNVGFRFPDAPGSALESVSLTIRRGARIGVIGPSGAGKSTLAGVLCGLLPPTCGAILVDGVPLDHDNATSFSAKIGYVPQSPFLFEGTLAENVAFSSWGRPYDRDRVREACTRAAIDFLDSHPDGLDQPIGENGTGLSGGQAQRVSIARALYPNPSILIFDEATSALDPGNEASIIQTIRNLPGTITSIIIAHRLSTVECCDTLVWIDKGRVVATGSPADVLPLYQAVNVPSALETFPPPSV